MRQYLDLMRDILEHGNDREDRTGVGTRSVFGRQLRFALGDGFPLLTTKKVHFKSVVVELLWFLAGSTDNRWLTERGVTIWNEWAAPDGSLGPIYGAQWRRWSGGASETEAQGHTVDQLADLVESLRHDPDSRRHLVSAWNPAVLPRAGVSPKDNAAAGRMALAPCHCLFQCYVDKGKDGGVGRLSLQLYQRSADLFLGVPFNIASYALLTHLLAQQCDLEPGDLVHTFGDVHLYRNHLTEDIVHEQLRRAPRALPRLQIHRRAPSLFDYQPEDFTLTGYDPHPPIRAPIAV